MSHCYRLGGRRHRLNACGVQMQCCLSCIALELPCTHAVAHLHICTMVNCDSTTLLSCLLGKSSAGTIERLAMAALTSAAKFMLGRGSIAMRRRDGDKEARCLGLSKPPSYRQRLRRDAGGMNERSDSA